MEYVSYIGKMDNRFEIVRRTEIGKDAWDEFVDASDEAWLWHRYDLQDAISTWYGKHDVSFAVWDKNIKKIVAVVPLHRIKPAGIFSLFYNDMDSLGGPACDNNLSNRYKQTILRCVYERITSFIHCNVREINLSLSPMSPALRGEMCPRLNPLLELGCANTLSQTWIIDLRSGKDSLWKSMEGRARTAIRKAEKSEIIVREANSVDDCDIYYRLHCETYQRTGVRPHPKEYFEEIWKNFLVKRLSKIWFAEHNGEVVAAENFGVYKKAAIYWTGAASSKGLAVEANSLLQWTAMQWMVDSGIEWYETGEAFPHIKSGKLKGLSDFKKSFGGKLYPYYKGKLRSQNKLLKMMSLLKEFIHEYKS